MALLQAVEHDIAIFSQNKLCSFYVLRCVGTDDYHVFAVVHPHENPKDKKGYIVSSHDNEKAALDHKIKYAKMMQNENISRQLCHATGWYRDNILN